jgi:hypothetical protein
MLSDTATVILSKLRGGEDAPVLTVPCLFRLPGAVGLSVPLGGLIHTEVGPTDEDRGTFIRDTDGRCWKGLGTSRVIVEYGLAAA